jgi:hypothetical protein
MIKMEEDNKAPTGERLATLEAQVKTLDSICKELKIVQECHGKRLEEISGENISISGKLDTLIKSSQDHLIFHEKQSEKKFSWGNLIIGILVSFCTIMTFINSQKQPEIRYIERPAYTQEVNK